MSEPGHNTILETAAMRLSAAGLSVIAVGPDKRPAHIDGVTYEWRPYQERLATPEEIHHWFVDEHAPKIGIVGGAVSGNLEVIDFDDYPTFETWLNLLEEHQPGLFERLLVVKTPRGNRHVLTVVKLLGKA